MNKQCSACGEDFIKEPGYYYGGAYVSYVVAVIFGIIVFAVTYLLLGLNEYAFFIIFAILQIVLLPVFFRLSRLIWINMFVKYVGK